MFLGGTQPDGLAVVLVEYSLAGENVNKITGLFFLDSILNFSKAVLFNCISCIIIGLPFFSALFLIHMYGFMFAYIFVNFWVFLLNKCSPFEYCYCCWHSYCSHSVCEFNFQPILSSSEPSSTVISKQ